MALAKSGDHHGSHEEELVLLVLKPWRDAHRPRGFAKKLNQVFFMASW